MSFCFHVHLLFIFFASIIPQISSPLFIYSHVTPTDTNINRTLSPSKEFKLSIVSFRWDIVWELVLKLVVLIIEIIHLSFNFFLMVDFLFIFPLSPLLFIQLFKLSYIFPSPPFHIEENILLFQTHKKSISFILDREQSRKKEKPKKIYNLQLCNRKFCVFSLIPLPFSLYNILVSNYIFIAKRLECAKAILL